eukprot:237287-Heterocapsa_arctica.AAC.1
MEGAQEEQNDQEVKDIQIVEDGNQVHEAVQRTKKRSTEPSENELYPGVSSQKRVKIRAEQLFKEAQANKAIQQEAAAQRNIHK